MNQPRRAFTLIELMVVIGIVAILMSLLLPSVLAARTTARRIACGANLKSVTSALLQYVQTYDSRYPIARDGGNKLGWDDLLYEFLSDTPLPDTIKNSTSFGPTNALKVFYCPDAATLVPLFDSSNRALQSYAMPSVGSNGTANYWQVSGSKFMGMSYLGAFTNSPTPQLEYRHVSSVPDPSGTAAFIEWSLVPVANSSNGQQGIGDSTWDVIHQLDPFTMGTTQNVTAELHAFNLNYAFADGHIECFKPDSKDVIGRGTTSSPGGIWAVDTKYR